MQTLAEAMAIAVLKGDLVAAYALADKLLEQRENPNSTVEAMSGTVSTNCDGYAVYQWPEFKAFCGRLGILWDLHTVDITIRLACDETPLITQNYRGREVQSSYNTTALHNRTFATRSPTSVPSPDPEV